MLGCSRKQELTVPVSEWTYISGKPCITLQPPTSEQICIDGNVAYVYGGCDGVVSGNSSAKPCK